MTATADPLLKYRFDIKKGYELNSLLRAPRSRVPNGNTMRNERVTNGLIETVCCYLDFTMFAKCNTTLGGSVNQLIKFPRVSSQSD